MRGLSRKPGHGRNIFVGDARIGYSRIPLSPAANGLNNGRRHSAEHRAVCFTFLCGSRREDAAAPGEWIAQVSARIHRLRHANLAADVGPSIQRISHVRPQRHRHPHPGTKICGLVCDVARRRRGSDSVFGTCGEPELSISSFAPGPDDQVAHAPWVET
jgi:hypothetical protein